MSSIAEWVWASSKLVSYRTRIVHFWRYPGQLECWPPGIQAIICMQILNIIPSFSALVSTNLSQSIPSITLAPLYAVYLLSSCTKALSIDSRFAAGYYQRKHLLCYEQPSWVVVWCLKVDVEGAVRLSLIKNSNCLKYGACITDQPLTMSDHTTLLYMRTTCAVIVINIPKKQS